LSESFFIPELFDCALGHADDTGETLTAYLTELSNAGEKILDIGAGTGRIAIPLARNGFKVTCIEENEGMLAKLRQKAEIENLGVLPVHQRFRATTDTHQYDAAIAVDDFLLGYDSIEELSNFFQDARTWTKKGGLLFTDVRPRSVEAMLIASGRLEVFPKVKIEEPKYGPWLSISISAKFNRRTMKLLTRYIYETFSDDGTQLRQFTKELHQTLFSNEDIKLAAERNGFSVKFFRPRWSDNQTQSDFGGFMGFRANV
jgi:cyclopropane fatty-acyl-phospholipid synthase-like methyltransferase